MQNRNVYERLEMAIDDVMPYLARALNEGMFDGNPFGEPGNKDPNPIFKRVYDRLQNTLEEYRERNKANDS